MCKSLHGNQQTPFICLFYSRFFPIGFHIVAQLTNNSRKSGSLKWEFGIMQCSMSKCLNLTLTCAFTNFFFCILFCKWLKTATQKPKWRGKKRCTYEIHPHYCGHVLSEWDLGISITRWLAGERSGVIISRDWRWPLVVPVITSQRVVLAFPLLFPHCTAGSEFQSAPDLQSPRF